MEPENDLGNIEYKLLLVDTPEFRIEELTTQMRFRCEEGEGECLYVLGVRDNGERVGLSDSEYEETIKNINVIASKNDFVVTALTKDSISKTRSIYEVMIRKKENKYKEIKVAVAGSVDSGKSSTIGYLTTGKNDDGRGLARTSVFNYIHELKTGRTSSIAQHIMGYDSEGKIVNYKDGNTWEDIVNRSNKIVTFYDLCGHEAYLKTTILGISATYPDFCMIMVSANNGVSRITKEHIFLCVTMKIPFVIVLSKIDICSDRKNVLEETISCINKLLKFPGIRRLPFNVKTMEDVILASRNIYTESVVPIFHTSNVSGEGIDNLQNFLNVVGNRQTLSTVDDPVEFHVDQVFNVCGFGLVIGGQLTKGTVKVGDKLYIGPLENKYETVQVKSIYCKKVSLQKVQSCRYVCLGIKKKLPIKRGHVAVSRIEDMVLTRTFQANITVLKSNATTIKIGYEPVLHSSSIRETVIILDIKDKKQRNNIANEDDSSSNVMRSGDTANVTLQFKYNSHFLKKNTTIILVEATTKITGVVTQTF